MEKNEMKFIKVRKSNHSHDRGFIATDAICAVFENKASNNVSIMTLDGFWYDVDDDVDALYEEIIELEKKPMPSPPMSTLPKRDYFRRKKMRSAPVDTEEIHRQHGWGEERHSSPPTKDDDATLDVFRPVIRKVKGRKPDVAQNHIAENLPSGDGEGQYNLNPKVEIPPSTEGL